MLIDHFGVRLCPACSGRDRCFACLRAMGGNGDRKRYALYDGRNRCARCSNEAVDDEEGLARTVPGVREYLRSMRVVSANRTRVRLRPYSELQARGSGTLGYTEMELGTPRTVRSINVADGLPMTLFGRVLAHEIAHAWLAGLSGDRGPLEEEGLCELVAAWWLRHRGGPLATHLLRAMHQSPDPVYGVGYRYAEAVAENHSRETVVELVTSGRWGRALHTRAVG
jgi:hypothetical protein